MTMTARVWSKKQTQETIKAFRDNGYEVEKKGAGHYESRVDGVLLFTALVGSGSTYLVRYESTLFE
jgi:hypothetical protein